MRKSELADIYDKRPFRVTNADEVDAQHILKLFVDPCAGLGHPFDFENTIVRGRKGSGKTMYLRANHAYYMYCILPSLLDAVPVVLPLWINLSEFQHEKVPAVIYRGVVLRMIRQMISIYDRLNDVEDLARHHLGVKSLAPDLLRSARRSTIFEQLLTLDSRQYRTRVTRELGLGAKIAPKFFVGSARYRKKVSTEIERKNDPSVSDFLDAYERLFGDTDTKVLVLFDEAGSLHSSFFRADGGASMFEVLMNQLRVLPNIRTKVTIYPDTDADALREMRYGDVVALEWDVHADTDYLATRRRTIALISQYINASRDNDLQVLPTILFDIADTDYGDVVEQIVNASLGNMRRTVHLLDLSMLRTQAERREPSRVSVADVLGALAYHAEAIERHYTPEENMFLHGIARVCKHRQTWQFSFPGRSATLNKLARKTGEHNIINVVTRGAGRKATTYAFDYPFCVAHGLPTHLIRGTRRLDKCRSLLNGEWISRAARVAPRDLRAAGAEGKIDGVIAQWTGKSGRIRTADGHEYAFSPEDLAGYLDWRNSPNAGNRPISEGDRVQFTKKERGGGALEAFDVQLM